MKEKIRKILFVIFLVIFIISMIYIITYLYTMKKDEKDLSVLQNMMSVKNKEEINNTLQIDENENIVENNQEISTNLAKVENLKKLQAEYADIVAWLEIENSSINYPVLQGKDNDYYLYKNYKGVYSRNGSIFLDYRYDFSKENQNFFVYGHNNNDQMMFNELIKYSEEEYYKSHQNISLITNQTVEQYEIVAVFKSEIFNKDVTDVFKYYKYLEFETEEKFNEFINNCKEKSLYKIDKDAEYGDKILTLSTCEYSKPNGRFVVVATLKQEVENMENK
ncbi:MAG: class B sortase [Clostridia bacterium]|nr:class B sortase [Clostridia bacterium]